jgi:hypothetical protein
MNTETDTDRDTSADRDIGLNPKPPKRTFCVRAAYVEVAKTKK